MLQSLVNGLTQGLLLGVVALAFSSVYATTRVFHIALGAIFTISPYVLLAAVTHGIPWPLGVAIALGVAVALAVGLEEAIHWPLEKKRAPSEVHFIGSLGASLVIVQLVVLLWGNDAKVLQTGADRVFSFAELRMTRGQVLGVVAAFLTLVATFAWLWRSNLGLELRGLASNPRLLAVFGHDIRRLRRLVFAMSGGLAAIASLAIAYDVGFEPNVGMRVVLVGVAAAIVGGRSSFFWATIAGMILGVLRAQVAWFASAPWEDAVTLAVLAACLFLLPGGLSSLQPAGKTRLEDDR